MSANRMVSGTRIGKSAISGRTGGGGFGADSCKASSRANSGFTATEAEIAVMIEILVVNCLGRH
jgi:ABC-type methionine transport system permease subunit